MRDEGPTSRNRTRIGGRTRARAIASTLKDWIAERGIAPGQRLPQERDLVSIFGVSKGTIREALKVLEAQGLIATRTGPGGGPFVATVAERHASELLGNYFFFQKLTIRDIYQLRTLLEPELAEGVVGRLSEADFARLAEKMKVYDHPPATVEEERAQRAAELEFHEVLVACSPNSLLRFVCGFLIRLLKDLTICRRIYDRPNPALREHGRSYQLQLIEALKRGDAPAVRSIMSEHMRHAQHLMEAQEAVVLNQFLSEQGGVPRAS